MGVRAVSFPLVNVARMVVYVNEKWEDLRAIVAREKPDLAFTGTFYISPKKAACHLKGDGYIWAEDATYNAYGYAWNRGPDLSMVLLPEGGRGFESYVSCCQLIRGGVPIPKLYYNADVGGKRGRVAMGVKGGALQVWAATDGADAKTPEGLRDTLAGLGWESAVMMDGGGKVNVYCGGQYTMGGAKSQNLILVWLKKDGEAPPKEETCMDCREKLVKAALGEVGVSAPTGDDKYISWYNGATGSKLAATVSWCAIFVSWCARQAEVCAGAVPNYASCTYAVGTFKRMGVWRDKGAYTPQRGDIVFFDWDREPSVSEHTGIVTGVADGWVQTVEGNSGSPGAVRQKSYALSSALILGYAAWGEAAPAQVPPVAADSPVKAAQVALNTRYKAGLVADGSWGPASKTAAVKAVQTEVNAVYKKALVVDGSFGPASRAVCPTLRRGDKNNLVWVLQLLLTVAGGKLALDSSFGPATEGAVVAVQQDGGLKADGAAGAAVFAALLK